MKIGRLEIADEKQAQMLSMLAPMRKAWAEQETIGQRYLVHGQNGSLDVPVLIYRPNGCTEKLPVFFNMHGGAWMAGDAVSLESLCQLLAESIPAIVVNINYHKADVIPIPEMSREAANCVKFFREHAEEFGIDSSRMSIGGYSAGANITSGTVLRLLEEGIPLQQQVLVYPCVDLRPESGSNPGWLQDAIHVLASKEEIEDIHASAMAAEDELLKQCCPTIIVACGRDDLKIHSLNYAHRLIGLGVAVSFKEYPNAEHGFIEVNRPEGGADGRNTPEQTVYTRDCEQWLIRQMRAVLYC